MTEDFYQVDHLDVREGTGMQRLLNISRARGLGKDIVSADKNNEAFLPTSVFLATEGSISYDEQKHELFFDTDPRDGVCPLDVVDGQHRLEGLRLAAEKEPRLASFPISVVLAHKMTETDKMLQFITVNTKQKTVDRGVGQHITARFTQMLDVEHLPYLPAWLRKEVEKGTDDQALRIVKMLNTAEDSPWHGRVALASEPKSDRHTTNQKTFVTALKKTILNKVHPFNTVIRGDERQHRVLINYWKAVNNIFVSPASETTGKKAPIVFKHNGLVFFFTLVAPVVNTLLQNRDFTVQSIEKCMRDAEEHLPPHAVQAMDPEFWASAGPATEMNRSGVAALAAEFAEAMRIAADIDMET